MPMISTDQEFYMKKQRGCQKSKINKVAFLAARNTFFSNFVIHNLKDYRMENKGKFKNGNQLWKLVEFPGRPKLYTPASLWEKFMEYMDYNSTVSWAKDDFIKSGPEAGKVISLEVPNPPSIRAFCVYAGISEDTFRNYGKNDADYLAVWHASRDIIQEIQVSGAATNIFNANIVARWAGLIDKKEVDIKSEMSDDERADTIKTILDKIRKE